MTVCGTAPATQAGADSGAARATAVAKHTRDEDSHAAAWNEAASDAGLSVAAPRAYAERGRTGPAMNQGEALELASRIELLRQLHIEKRRTDRTKSPLSVVVFTLDSVDAADHSGFWQLLQLLSESKRVTDILGYLSDQKVALLLPHTDAGGAHALIAIIRKKAERLPLQVAAATYPDELFDSLMQETQSECDPAELLFQVPLYNPPYLDGVLKRSLDVAGALIGLILFSPVMLVAAIAVKATSPGPVIFRQSRVGLRGRPFQFLKFRSMRADSDDRIHREYVSNLIDGKLDTINMGDAGRPLYKLKGDPRVTAVGRIIRKTSIDELPQLLNVLKGDMSLVGPRPPLSYEAEKYESWHLRRVLEIRPGITGLWQVYGRSSTSFDEMVRLDLKYIRSASLWLDFKLLLATVRVLLGHHGAA